MTTIVQASKFQCPKCLKWFTKSHSYIKCKGIRVRLQTAKERFRGSGKQINKDVRTEARGFGDKLALGFAMMDNEYED